MWPHTLYIMYTILYCMYVCTFGMYHPRKGFFKQLELDTFLNESILELGS